MFYITAIIATLPVFALMCLTMNLCVFINILKKGTNYVLLHRSSPASAANESSYIEVFQINSFLKNFPPKR